MKDLRSYRCKIYDLTKKCKQLTCANNYHILSKEKRIIKTAYYNSAYYKRSINKTVVATKTVYML